jgi:hypothetical protein
LSAEAPAGSVLVQLDHFLPATALAGSEVSPNTVASWLHSWICSHPAGSVLICRCNSWMHLHLAGSLLICSCADWIQPSCQLTRAGSVLPNVRLRLLPATEAHKIRTRSTRNGGSNTAKHSCHLASWPDLLVSTLDVFVAALAGSVLTTHSSHNPQLASAKSLVACAVVSCGSALITSRRNMSDGRLRLLYIVGSYQSYHTDWVTTVVANN